jgi:hypothetical protein
VEAVFLSAVRLGMWVFSWFMFGFLVWLAAYLYSYDETERNIQKGVEEGAYRNAAEARGTSILVAAAVWPLMLFALILQTAADLVSYLLSITRKKRS